MPPTITTTTNNEDEEAPHLSTLLEQVQRLHLAMSSLRSSHDDLKVYNDRVMKLSIAMDRGLRPVEGGIVLGREKGGVA